MQPSALSPAEIEAEDRYRRDHPDDPDQDAQDRADNGDNSETFDSDDDDDSDSDDSEEPTPAIAAEPPRPSPEEIARVRHEQRLASDRIFFGEDVDPGPCPWSCPVCPEPVVFSPLLLAGGRTDRGEFPDDDPPDEEPLDDGPVESAQERWERARALVPVAPIVPRPRARLKHGLAKRGKRDPIYRTWYTIRDRCLNPNNPRYKRYGPLGISEEWARSREAFDRDVRPTWKPGHVLDRRDNTLGYSKENFRWATPGQNARNR